MSLAEDHKIRNSMDIPTLVDCGCVVTVWKDGSGVEIAYCPAHKIHNDELSNSLAREDEARKRIKGYQISLDQLIQGAKLALAELDRIGGDIGFEPDRYRERIRATEVLSRAVRDVEKGEGDNEEPIDPLSSRYPYNLGG